MNKFIKFGVVGCGHIGKRHANMIQQGNETELVAICDVLSREKLELTDDFAQVPLYTNIEELLDEHNYIDVVCICTPNAFHVEQALKVLDAKKHVVIEKPMGLSSTDCESIIYKALNVSKQVFCVMQNRYSPPAKWLKSILNDQKLGEIFMVQVNCYWNRDDRYYFPNGKRHDWHGSKKLDGGTLFTQFSHFIDILYWLFGDIVDIQAKFSDFNHSESTDFEDSGFVNFRFVSGGLGCLNFSTAVWESNFESSITILGSKGTIKIGGQYMDKVENCHISGYELPELEPSNPANDYGGYKGSANNHGSVFENVVDVLKGRKEITTNALEGLKVVDIIERIYKAGNGSK